MRKGLALAVLAGTEKFPMALNSDLDNGALQLHRLVNGHALVDNALLKGPWHGARSPNLSPY